MFEIFIYCIYRLTPLVSIVSINNGEQLYLMIFMVWEKKKDISPPNQPTTQFHLPPPHTHIHTHALL